MRIGIDVRYLSHGLVGGVHTYVAQLIPALLDIGRGHEIFLYADRKRPFEIESLPDNVTLRLLPWSNSLSSIVNDLTMGQVIERDRIEVMHFPANYGFAPRGTHAVITVHDAINLLPLREIVRGHPKRVKTIVGMSYLHFCTVRAVRRANLLLTDSQFAAGDIARVSGFDPARIRVAPIAPARDFRRVTDPEKLAEVRQRHDLEQRFVLADALKNPAALLRAWQMLPPGLRARYEVVFFSRTSAVLPAVRDAFARGEVHLLAAPSREDLRALYSMAEVFVFPSWIEGFGIPVLEAMTCGAPVIASDRGALPEVTGGAARLVEADDAAGLARQIECVLTDPKEARRMRERGFERARAFSWQETARIVLDAYQAAVA